jgi:hypothetical protein
MPGYPTTTPSGRDLVFLPGMFLLVLAVLNLLLSLLPLFIGIRALTINDPAALEALEQQAQRFDLPYTGQEMARMGATVYLSAGIPEFLFAIITIIGAICMLAQRGYAMAVIAAVLMAIPILSLMACPCLAGIGIGIWCLVVLFNPDVRAAFK